MLLAAAGLIFFFGVLLSPYPEIAMVVSTIMAITALSWGERKE
jgi:hypothetical protein